MLPENVIVCSVCRPQSKPSGPVVLPEDRRNALRILPTLWLEPAFWQVIQDTYGWETPIDTPEFYEDMLTQVA